MDILTLIRDNDVSPHTNKQAHTVFDLSAPAPCPRCDASAEPVDAVPDARTLNERGAVGHHGSDDYVTCSSPSHWDRLPKS